MTRLHRILLIADEGDQLCQFFDGHDNNEVMTLPLKEVQDPEIVSIYY